MQLLNIMKFCGKNCEFLVILVKKCIYHVTKGVKRIFQLLVSFNFLKSILDDAIVLVELKIIFESGLNT